MANKSLDARPSLWKLPALNLTELDAVACRTVEANPKVMSGDHESRLRALAALIEDELEVEAAHRAERDKIAVATDHFFHLRRGAAIHDALGVSRTRWTVIKRTTTGRRFKRDADVEHLAHYASLTYSAQARAAHARRLRDLLVLELVEQGWTNVMIGELIGRDPSQVAHIKWPEGAGPREAVAS